MKQWAEAVADRCPGGLSWQHSAITILDDMKNARLVAGFALKAPKGEQRYRQLELLDVYLADFAEEVASIRERSKPQTAPAHVLTKDQFGSFLREMCLLEMELDRMKTANAALMEEKPAEPDRSLTSVLDTLSDIYKEIQTWRETLAGQQAPGISLERP